MIYSRKRRNYLKEIHWFVLDWYTVSLLKDILFWWCSILTSFSLCLPECLPLCCDECKYLHCRSGDNTLSVSNSRLILHSINRMICPWIMFGSFSKYWSTKEKISWYLAGFTHDHESSNKYHKTRLFMLLFAILFADWTTVRVNISYTIALSIQNIKGFHLCLIKNILQYNRHFC